MGNIGKMKMAVNPAYPYASDDSLSVYEFLGKIIIKLNEVVTLVNLKIPDDFDGRYADMLRTYTEDELMNLLENGLLETFFTQFSEAIEAVGAEFSDTVEAVGSEFQSDFNTLTGLFSGLQSQFDTAVGDIQVQADTVIANATVDSEVILARGTKATLGARLDSTAQRIDNIVTTLSSEFPATNLVKNGSFENDLEGWTDKVTGTVTGTIVSDSAIKKTGNTSKHIILNTNRVTYTQPITCQAGDKIYLSGWVYITTPMSDSQKRYIYIGDPNVAFPKVPNWDNSLVGQWQRKSVIITATSAVIHACFGRAADDTADYHIDGIIAVNLSDIFGNGNEPSVEDFEEYLSEYDNYYFDDTVSPFVTNKSIVSIFSPKKTVEELTTKIAANETDITEFENEIAAIKSKNMVLDSACYQHADTGMFIDKVSISNTSDILAFYDELVTLYPDYVTKSLLGNEATGLPIYRYDFTPPQNQGFPNIENKKMLYVTGTHGGEIPPCVDAVRFFKGLCSAWENSDILSDLRWNVHFVVIPVLNPYGINNRTRKNSNGVDLNRNFPVGWTANTDTNHINYPGPTPLSEIESQLLYNLYQTEDFIFALDCHTFDTYQSAGKIMYMVSLDNNDGKNVSLSNSFGKFTTAKLKRNFDFIEKNNSSLSQNIVFAAGSSEGSMYGIFNGGMLIEWVFAWGTGISGTPEELQKYVSESIASLLYSAYQYYS